jgi:hypothetical protein
MARNSERTHHRLRILLLPRLLITALAVAEYRYKQREYQRIDNIVNPLGVTPMQLNAYNRAREKRSSGIQEAATLQGKEQALKRTLTGSNKQVAFN